MLADALMVYNPARPGHCRGMPISEPEPPTYRWIVVAVSTAINALAWGTRATFALFFIAMLHEFSWGRGLTALGYSLSWLGFVVFAPMAGWLHDRFGARTVVMSGALVLGAALVLTSGVTSLVQYYVWFGGMTAAGIACLLIPSTTIVTRWFAQGRGAAMGILSTGGPASAVIFYPLNGWLIATLGWRRALAVFGCIVAAAAVALALLYRDPPAGRRLGDAATSQTTGNEWTLRRALRTGRLWAAFTMTALGVIGFQIMATHQVAHAVDRGFNPTTVVAFFAFGGLSMMAGNLLGGWLSDRLGSGGVFGLGSLVAIAGIACFAAVRGPQDEWLLVCYTSSGVGFGMRIAQLATIPAAAFAGPRLGTILGIVQAGGGLGGAIGPFVGGWLFDHTGSYRLTFIAAGVAVAGSGVAAWRAARPSPPRETGQSERRAS